MNSISRLFQEVPDFGEVLFYAIAVAVMLVALILGRLILRSMVNSRVRNIHAQGLDLGDLSSMGQKGLLTDEELKKIRKRFAERQLQETKEEASGIKARDLLLAIEADPSRATSLLPPSSEHAERSLEGLKKPEAKSVEEQLRAQLGESAAPKQDAADPTPPRNAPPERPSTGAPRVQATRPVPAAPDAEPRPAPEVSPPAGKSAPKTPPHQGGMDLDGMLANGLISKREYDLLMARVKKAGG
jgi:hypothetical protein